MTTVTMLDRVASRGATGGTDPGWDTGSGDLPVALRALEARKTLLSGATAALGAPDSQAAGLLFEAALADPEARRWPFDLARVHLLYGERLRRSRDITRSRHHLRAALTAFERLGASCWADRAAAELAATALVRQRRDTGQPELLTAQELQVAELAAAGLSNREIAARLDMAPRTVGSHLYRIFPKLGISSRAALRDALSRSGAWR
jgi:DNA-binding CsgD family transcriptional regulator